MFWSPLLGTAFNHATFGFNLLWSSFEIVSNGMMCFIPALKNNKLCIWKAKKIVITSRAYSAAQFSHFSGWNPLLVNPLFHWLRPQQFEFCSAYIEYKETVNGAQSAIVFSQLTGHQFGTYNCSVVTGYGADSQLIIHREISSYINVNVSPTFWTMLIEQQLFLRTNVIHLNMKTKHSPL